jgi:hypothetical protein
MKNLFNKIVPLKAQEHLSFSILLFSFAISVYSIITNQIFAPVPNTTIISNYQIQYFSIATGFAYISLMIKNNILRTRIEELSKI